MTSACPFDTKEEYSVRTRILIVIITLAPFLTGCGATPRTQITMPTPTPAPTRRENALVTNTGAPTAIAFTPDGRLLRTTPARQLPVPQHVNDPRRPAVQLSR